MANSLFVTTPPVSISEPNFSINLSPNTLLLPVSPMLDTKDSSTVTLRSAGAELVSLLTGLGTIASSTTSVSPSFLACVVAKLASATSISLTISASA